MTQPNRNDPEFVKAVEELAEAWESSLNANTLLSRACGHLAVPRFAKPVYHGGVCGHIRRPPGGVPRNRCQHSAKAGGLNKATAARSAANAKAITPLRIQL